MEPKRKQGEEKDLEHEIVSAHWKDVHGRITKS